MLSIHICHFSADIQKELRKRIASDFKQRVLRQVLHTDNPVRIGYREQGKPWLVDCPNVFVSYSDSTDYAAFAVSDQEIGIDMECIRPHRYMEILKRFFLPEESAFVLEKKREEERLKRFVCLWTKKESLLKYTGLGLGGGMRSHKVMRTYGIYAEKKIPFQTWLVQKGKVVQYNEDSAQIGDLLLTICRESLDTPVFSPILFLPE